MFGFYDAERVFDAALQAVTGAQRVTLRDEWLPLIKKNPANLKDALIRILTGPCASYEVNANGEIVRQPLLLIIDDLEQILVKPAGGDGATATVKDSHRPMLAAVLEAFAEAGTESRLVLTSRYDFALPSSTTGLDLAERLARVQLPRFDELERTKQQSAAARNEPAVPAQTKDDAEKQRKLLARCRELPHGNPLIQERLTRMALTEPEAARAALDKLEAYLASGAAPEGEDLSDIFERLAFQSYEQALSKDEREAFRALTLFDLPVPESALRAAAACLAHEAAEKALARLYGLGLLDRFEPWRKDGESEGLANALARPHFEALSEDERRTLAKAALPPLLAAWTDEDGDLPFDVRSLEAYRLAELAGDIEARARAARYGGRWLFDRMHDPKAAFRATEPALKALIEAGVQPDAALLRLGIELAARLGESTLQDEWLALIGELEGVDERSQAMLLTHQAERLITKGELDDAERLLRRAEAAFRSLGDVRERAFTMGKIADILYRRGELDEALRIRREEELPVYDRLGDVRSSAVTMGDIADILYRRGELDEALRIRREEELPVYDRLGDVRSSAVTMGKIADILYRRGELDEALRIRREEELPVYDRLGDVRSSAVTMGKIADILESRGELDEALRIRREEELPVYDRLGDVHSRAVTMGKIADILYRRGELDEALRIHEEERRPIAEQLQDVDGLIAMSCDGLSHPPPARHRGSGEFRTRFE